MGKRKNFTSFAEAAAELEVPRLELPEFDLGGSVEELEMKARETREEAKRAATWVKQNQAKLDQLAGLSADAQGLVRDKVAKIEATRDSLFGHLNETVRKEARKAYLTHCLSRSFEDREGLQACLEQLVRDGHLIRDGHGPFLVGYVGYRSDENSAFTEKETDEIRAKLEEQWKGLQSSFRREVRSQAEYILSQGSISVQDLVSGKRGNCAFFVPPQRLTSEDGEEVWLPSATVLLQSNGTDIFPLQMAGNPKTVEAFERAKGLHVRLHISSLEWEHPPFVRPLEIGKEIRRLWHLVKAGLTHEKKMERVQSLRDIMTQKANVSREQFFLERMPGICLVAFDGTWRNNGSNYPHLFLLVKREEEDGGRFLSVEEVPDDEELQEFFRPCQGTKYPEQGERFELVGQPLRAVLKAVCGQTRKAEGVQE